MPEDKDRIERLQTVYGYKVDISSTPLENLLTIENFLKKLEQRYAEKIHKPDLFGRSSASPKHIKEMIDKSKG